MTSELKLFTLGIIGHKKHWGYQSGIKTKGGFGRQIEEISRYFSKVILVVPLEERTNSEPGYILQIENLDVVPLPYYDGSSNLGKLSFLIKAPKISKTIWDAYGKCDYIHYRLPGYVGIMGILVHKIRKSKPGFAWIGTDWAERILKTRDTWSRRILARIADRAIPWLIKDICTFAVGKLAEKYPVHNQVYPVKTTVVSEEDIIKDRSSVISGSARLLYVGRLAPEKGLPYLINALKLCKESGTSCHLTIIGNGKERANLEKMVTEYGLAGEVSFLGYIPLGKDLWHKYLQADIFVFPSLSEGQPKVLVEAMAAGLPIVATNAGGIPKIIRDGFNGTLVPLRSAEALCKAIQLIINDPELFKSMRENGIKSVKSLPSKNKRKK